LVPMFASFLENPMDVKRFKVVGRPLSLAPELGRPRESFDVKSQGTNEAFEQEKNERHPSPDLAVGRRWKQRALAS